MTPGPPGGGQAEPLHTGGGGVVMVGPAIFGSATEGGRGGGQADPLQPGGGGVTMTGPVALVPVVQGGRPRTPHVGAGGVVFLGAANLPGRLGPGPSRRLKRARASGLARPNWTSIADCHASGVKANRTSGAAPAG